MTRIDVAKYLAGQYQGLAYMRRLRDIEDEEARQMRALAAAREEAATDEEWLEVVAAWDFGRLNRLVEAHNAYYPIEAGVPMNPRTGTWARDWRRPLYDAGWILERFPTAARAPRAASE